MGIGQEHPAAARGNEPPSYSDSPESYDPAANRGRSGNLLSSSANRGWSGLSAELRSHGKGTIPLMTSRSDIEISVYVRGNESLVTRRAAGIEDRTFARRGTIWLSPPGLQRFVDHAEDLAGLLHMCLPLSQFSPSNLGSNIDGSAIGALRYERAFEDPLLCEIAGAIASELQAETSAGRLLVESLANSMAARLLQMHIGAPSAQSRAFLKREGLDRLRLLRVLDYIEANLEGDLSLDRMASIACLSKFHFARAFKQAVGQSPHRYVSARRLERAKALLVENDRPLVDIALALSFSSQANFTRAFTQATGQAPGQYRQQFGSWERVSSLTDTDIS
jgi:AraC family transcriptional regulator